MALFLAAHAEGTTRMKRWALMLISIFIILGQCTVLCVIVYESSHPRCMQHSDCNEGNFCAPSTTKIYPGTCFDCLAAELRTRQFLISNGREWLSVGDDEYWDEASQHCNETDTMPTLCDHYINSREAMSGGGFLVLIFSAFVALIPAVQDLDQSHEESIVMGILSARSPLFYISNRLRMYLIPCLVVAASASLILSDRFTSQNFLLNGMAIGFASSIDDLLSFICLTGRAREEVEEKVEELLKQEDKAPGWKQQILLRSSGAHARDNCYFH